MNLTTTLVNSESKMLRQTLLLVLAVLISSSLSISAIADDYGKVGVGAEPIDGAEMIIDGSRKMLDEKWTYW